jgi:hypothetical protein
MQVDVFPPFLLKEKVGPKVQGKPERSARFALPTHKYHPTAFFIFHLFTDIVLMFLQTQLFQMPIV